MSKKILQINFKIKVPRSDNEEKKEAGGIYLFKDESSLKAFLEGNIVAEVMKHPALSDIEAKIFDVMDKHSKVTHGPVS